MTGTLFAADGGVKDGATVVVSTTRFNNYGGPSLHDKLVSMISAAERRVWIMIPWWDTSPPARELLAEVMAAAQRGVDVLVLSRPEASNDAAHRELRRAAITLVPVRYIHQKELLADAAALTHSMNFTGTEIERNQNAGTLTVRPAEIEAVEAGFREIIDNHHAAVNITDSEYTRSDTLIPPALQKFMTRYPTLNPLQSMAVPKITATSGHVMVVAPTGAGKTLIGEVAVLRAIVEEQRPAVWLLPARALAAEVAQSARRWREHRITAIELTGETNVSSEAVQKAQLWIATTEKFEALYRRSSLRDFIGRVGCIVIDEVHLVGDSQRGATLESLIARLRAVSERTRIVALSATVANAEELAGWFNAELLTSDWRPTILTRQFVSYDEPPGGKYEPTQQVKDRVLRSLLSSFAEQQHPLPDNDDSVAGQDASVLVFCGSKNIVRRTAALAADLHSYKNLDDERLVEACFGRGVGIHFRDAPHAGRALTAFKERTIHTLIATSGLSTGVNTPARIVVIRDLELGMSPLEVSQAQQMLGRAGRAGQESEGYGFVMVPRPLEAEWRRQLRDGYSARSQVVSQLSDVMLAEILLGSISDRLSAVSWFEETFAFAQSGDPLQVDIALDFLIGKGFVADSGTSLTVTRLGALTSRLMVDVASAASIRTRLTEIPVPESAGEAEELLLAAVACATDQLRDWPVNKRVYQPIVDMLLQSWSPRAVDPLDEVFGARFCLAAAHLALRDPPKLRAKTAPPGVSLAEFRRAIDDMPRYLAWISALGYLDQPTAVWAAAVAGDVARRLTWWTLSPHPQRGTGRLLWLLENTLNPENRRTALPELWRRATDHGYVGPDKVDARPGRVDISREQFSDLIRGRAVLQLGDVDGLSVPISRSTADARVTVLANSGPRQVTASVQPVPTTMTLPVPHGSDVGPLGADVFLYTRAGDFAYQNVMTTIPDDAATHTDPIEEATAALTHVQPVAVVASPVGWVKQLLMTDRRKRAATVRARIAPDEQLRPVAEALAEHDTDPAAAVLAMRRNIVTLLNTRPAGEPRSVVAILTSGEASPEERETVLAALLNTLGFEVGIASINRSLAALICLGGQWRLVTLTTDDSAEVEPLFPASLPTFLRVVSPPQQRGTDVPGPRCGWVTDFVL